MITERQKERFTDAVEQARLGLIGVEDVVVTRDDLDSFRAGACRNAREIEHDTPSGLLVHEFRLSAKSYLCVVDFGEARACYKV